MQTTERAPASGFDLVMYLVHDLPRARAFYEAVLELTVGEFETDGFVEYALPDGNTFALAVAPPGAHLKCGGVMFAVPDVALAVERVKANGGTYVMNYGGSICDSGWCLDPDGNPFGVHKRYAGR